MLNQQQICFWPIIEAGESVPELPVPDLAEYDRFAVAFSGGKDSVACVLHLLEQGVPGEKIELHHHLVDGREGSTLMDWPVTEAYCRAFAAAFGLKLYLSWKVGGFEREMLRDGDRTAAISFESECGEVVTVGGEGGKLSTRLKFPQLSGSLSTRWCSAYVKIDVFSRLMNNEPRFLSGKTCVVSGERAAESPWRATYASFEPSRSDNRNGSRVKRHIDHWRPVHKWNESEVWAIIERHRVRAHPAYYCGFGRCSCRSCIFGSPDQWATIAKYYPDAFEVIARYEERFGVTIHRKDSVRIRAASGTPYVADEKYFRIAGSVEYAESIIVEGAWELPAGAYGESTGPT